MKMRPSRARVAGVTDASDDLAALYLLPLVDARRISREVRVIILPLLVGRALVDRDAPSARACARAAQANAQCPD